MRSRLLSLLLAAVLLTGLLALPAHAADDSRLWVYDTDILALIDGYPIRSYNINGYTYVVIEDLADYGFGVTWDADSHSLTISPTHTVRYTSLYSPDKDMHLPGERLFPVWDTDISVWIAPLPVTYDNLRAYYSSTYYLYSSASMPIEIQGCYNIGGYTCISMDTLAAHFASSYTWSPETHTLSLVTREGTEAQRERMRFGQWMADCTVKIYKDKIFEEAAKKDSEWLYGDTDTWEYFFRRLSCTVTDVTKYGTIADIHLSITSPDYYDVEYLLISRIFTNAFAAYLTGREDYLSDERTAQAARSIMTSPELKTVTRDVTLHLYYEADEGQWYISRNAVNADFLSALVGGLFTPDYFSTEHPFERSR